MFLILANASPGFFSNLGSMLFGRKRAATVPPALGVAGRSMSTDTGASAKLSVERQMSATQTSGTQMHATHSSTDQSSVASVASVAYQTGDQHIKLVIQCPCCGTIFT